MNPPLWRNEFDSPPSAALALFILHPSAFILPAMAHRPVIFISATSDLRSARDLVGKVLYSMGYEPHWEEIQAVTGGEMLDVLRGWIEKASLVVQLVGRRYGKEPPHNAAEFGRVSYTQFEGLEAQRIGKRVIYYLLDDRFPTKRAKPEPQELSSLQSDYRQRLVDANYLLHDKISSHRDLELSIRRTNDTWRYCGNSTTAAPHPVWIRDCDPHRSRGCFGPNGNQSDQQLSEMAKLRASELCGSVGGHYPQTVGRRPNAASADSSRYS